VTDREVQAAAARVESLGADARRCLEAAAALALAAVAALAVDAGPWLAVAAGAPALAVAAAIRARQRLALIDRLALDPHAYAIPAVERHGRRAASRRQRRIIATRLESLTQPEWGPLVVPERVDRYRRELDELGRRIAAPGADLAPPQAVECRRLLTRTTESALYNADLPAEDLGAALRRIEAGISVPQT
jgi:hypothetical protein